MNILVTGGAGYIGSHTTRVLLDQGHNVVVLDSLEKGYRQAVPAAAAFVEGTTHDQALVEKLLRDESIAAVIHFAAYKAAGESVKLPGRYFHNNVSGTIALLNAMAATKVKQLVFSSTCAVYGNPAKVPADETLPIQPENPYGESKALVERMLPWYDQAHGIRSAILRYFNVAGAWEDGSLGEDPSRVESLIPLVLQAAAGKRDAIKLFGTDYPTPDGTAIRDYIHVLDLAEGHMAALHYLNEKGKTDIFNLGTGKGLSVQEIIDAAQKVTGQIIPVVKTERRPGDPARVWGNTGKAKKVLHWQSKRTLEDVLKSAWEWQLAHPDGFRTSNR